MIHHCRCCVVVIAVAASIVPARVPQCVCVNKRAAASQERLDPDKALGPSGSGRRRARGGRGAHCAATRAAYASGAHENRAPPPCCCCLCQCCSERRAPSHSRPPLVWPTLRARPCAGNGEGQRCERNRERERERDREREPFLVGGREIKINKTPTIGGICCRPHD